MIELIAAVRPDRDPTGNQRTPRAKKHKLSDDLLNHVVRSGSHDKVMNSNSTVIVIIVDSIAKRRLVEEIADGSENTSDAADAGRI